MPKTVAIVQARLGSSRLPGKALRVLRKRTLLSHVLERAMAIQGVDLVVLATSTQEPDGAVEQAGLDAGVQVYRGPEKDVLSRMLEAAIAHDADVIMRVTGDCPLLCPEVAGAVLALYRQMNGFAYAWNDVRLSGYPDGTDVEVFSFEMLRGADMFSLEQDREHVTPYIRAQYRVETIRHDSDESRWKLSVDTQADYAFVTEVYRHLKPKELTLQATLAACHATQQQEKETV